MTNANGAAAYRRDELAGFWRRFGAWMIDGPARFALGLGLVFLPTRLLVVDQARRYDSSDANVLWHVMPVQARAMVFALWLFAVVIVPWLYTAIQEASMAQATFGKRLLRIRVTDVEGDRISFGRASGRFFGRLIPTLGIGYLIVLFTPRKQALHDLIAGCLVVRSPADAQ